ncbi:DUF1801 domain-containing protein [Altibacter sp. HG106]|nr:DUF1801 domain-containing protein [Altibacter sp. HG106]MDC7996144.1 DUF1801 domain-containing protein [Altibacter sp. HG106]
MNPANTYIHKQPEPFRSILLHLQSVVQQTIPNGDFLFKWQLPFYYLDGTQPFCYLNYSKTYVDLVFWHGAHLKKHEKELVSKGRKHMRSLRYTSLEAIDHVVLTETLLEAYSLRHKSYK